MSKAILSFRFYFCLGFPAGRRTGSIALDRDEAKSTSMQRRCARESAELVLVAFFAVVPL